MTKMWIVFGGSEECPIIIKFIINESDLISFQLKNDEWVEEFEIDNEDLDKEIICQQ
jgi:hypothetical protein